MTLTPAEVHARYKWVPMKITPDTSYWPVSQKFLREVANEFWKVATAYHLTKWETFWDCDNFSDLYRLVAHAHHARYYAKDTGCEAPAVGQVFYLVWRNLFEKAGMGHAINTFVDQDGKVGYIEPQAVKAMALDQEFITLNEKEVGSIWMVRM